MDQSEPDANLSWITDTIAIGNYLAARDGILLKSEGIRSILCLDKNHSKPDADVVEIKAYEKIPLVDAKGNDSRLFRRAVRALADLVEQAPPVLVHCHAGRSRSVVVVAGYLMITHRLDPDKALSEIARKRDSAVTTELRCLLETLEEQ